MYEQEVIDLIKKEIAFMASVDGNRPRIRPMKPYIDNEGHIWLFSRFDSKKVASLQENPRVELGFLGKSQEVLTVYGRLKDATKPGEPAFRVIRDLMFADYPEMKTYFSKGEENSFILYRLVVHEVNYMRENRELTTRVNLPMSHDPDVELALCQGGFCLMS